MSDTVKLIIEIPKDYYEIIKYEAEHHLTDYRPLKIIGNGIPLDSNSEKAEVQAYFDGQAYGWEQGRKALIDDVKAEIIYLRDSWETDCYHEEAEALNVALKILDNIGKAESESRQQA